MVKFATYFFRYSQADLFPPREWENRQQHLAALFEKDDSILFGDGLPSDEQTKEGIPYAKVYNHRVYHLKSNRNIIVMQFANSIDIPVESKFEQKVVKDEPSLFVIIDNRKDLRTVAIQNRRKAFSAPQRVAQIMADKITSTLFSKYNYSAEILPVFYPVDLFKAWQEQQQHAQALRFSPSVIQSEEELKQKLEEIKDKDYFDVSLMSPLMQMRLEAKKANYEQKITVMPDDKKTALYVDKTSIYMKNLITLASATGDPVELITKEGTVFKCFVEPDEEYTDKIVHHQFDDALLEMLFRGHKANGEKAEEADIARAEAAVMEMLNGMKHESEDIEKRKEVVA